MSAGEQELFRQEALPPKAQLVRVSRTADGRNSGEARPWRVPKVQTADPRNLSGKRTEPAIWPAREPVFLGWLGDCFSLGDGETLRRLLCFISGM